MIEVVEIPASHRQLANQGEIIGPCHGTGSGEGHEGLNWVRQTVRSGDREFPIRVVYWTGFVGRGRSTHVHRDRDKRLNWAQDPHLDGRKKSSIIN